MKSSTRNIELQYDVSSDACDGCKALKANVDVRGGRARRVELRCEVADAVDSADEDEMNGVSLSQICKGIRAKMTKAECPFIDEIRGSYPCIPLKDAAGLVRSTGKKSEKKE